MAVWIMEPIRDVPRTSMCFSFMFICYALTSGTARGLSRTKGYHVAVDAIPFQRSCIMNGDLQVNRHVLDLCQFYMLHLLEARQRISGWDGEREAVEECTRSIPYQHLMGSILLSRYCCRLRWVPQSRGIGNSRGTDISASF